MTTSTITKQQARQKIQDLIDEFRRVRREEKAYFERMSETDVVNKFVTPLLDALGWPTKGTEYQQEVYTYGGRPDIRAEYTTGEYIYVEAKRFGVIERLSRNTLAGVLTPGQMMLPGMAADRTKEEQQAINYAFANNGTWAILTNFETFRLFNARRDWLVFSIENPDGYLEEDFEYLWQLAWHNIKSGSLDTLSNQRARADVDSDYLNFINEWRLKLAQDIVGRRAENAWAFDESGEIKLPLLRSVVQRLLDRLVVIRYAEDHLIAPAGTLQNLLELSRTNPYAMGFSDQMVHLYRNFDRMHNSALFALGDADKASLSSSVLEGLVGKLYEARFRAMTPDIMGNTYEQYLGKALAIDGKGVKTQDNLETRKKQGSYYTPQVIVRYIVDNSLGRYLYGTQNGRPDGDLLEDESEQRKTWEQIKELRLIDPACGSGSFLIYAYEVLADYYRREMRRIEKDRQDRYEELVANGVTTPFDLQLQLTEFVAALDTLRDYPSIILEQHIYGVDLDPQAAEIATVNLIMRAMADQRDKKTRLPLILNQNVKVGNALIGAGPDDDRYIQYAAELAELRQIRLKLVSDPNGHTELLERAADITNRLNATLNTTIAPYFLAAIDDWEDAIRPFHWVVGFPELFTNENGLLLGDEGGFTLVIGNPPWEIVKPDLREYYAQFDADLESKLTRKKAEARIQQLVEMNPNLEIGWEAQKRRITATSTYYKGAKYYTKQAGGDTATHKLFTEQGYLLLQNKGRLGFVIPSGIYSDLGTKDLREMLLKEGRIEYLYNFSNERFFFQQVDHRVKFTLLGSQKGVQSDGFWATFRFNPRVAVRPIELESFLNQRENLVFIQESSIERFSPQSLSIMEFQSQVEVDIAEKIYGDFGTLEDEISGCWNIQFGSEFHMTSARSLFQLSDTGILLYEGKIIHQFKTDLAQPRYWLKEQDVKNPYFRIAIRAIARSTDIRTLISAILPPKSGAGNSLLTTKNTLSPHELMYISAVFNSYVLDSVIRQKIATNINMFFLYQLPIPRKMFGNKYFDAITPRAAALSCTTADFAELWESVMDTPWTDPADSPTLTKESGFSPTADPAQRQILRDELDAIIAHLYGLSRDDFEHILGTFPLVFPDGPEGDEKKAALLATYDRFKGM